MAERSPEDVYRLLVGALLASAERPYSFINGVGLHRSGAVHIFTEIDENIAGRIAEQFRIVEVKLESRFIGQIVPAAAPGDSIKVAGGLPGTLGCLVEDIHRQPYFLTCDHVAGTLAGAAPGDAVYDKKKSVIGHFVRGSTVRLSHSVHNTVDAALIEPIDTTSLVNNIPSLGAPSGSAFSTVGEKARKYGAQTKMTDGEVSYIVSSQIIPYVKGNALFTDQLVLERYVNSIYADQGDSGSVVLNDSNQVIGLLYAVSTKSKLGFANRIHSVLSALQVSIL
jgi:hypothetical protein